MKIIITSYKIKPGQFSILTRFVNHCICFFTSSEYWHTSINFGNIKYESGHPDGVSKCTFIPQHGQYLDIDEYEVSEESYTKMLVYAEKCRKEKIKYNHAKLIILMFWQLWDKLKWAPFSDNKKYGMVCSVFVREVALQGNLDLCPDRFIETTTPQDCKREDLICL